MLSHIFLLTAVLSTALTAEAKLRTCKARNIPAIDVFGLEILDLTAKEVHDFTDWGQRLDVSTKIESVPISFCNLTVTYTHPGQNDTIHVYVWLPFDDWNGRFLGQGGGAFATGNEGALASSISMGYAAATTDGGHSIFGDPMDVAANSHKWGLLSPGNVNWVLLQDFASRALDDLPKIAKQVIQGFYGEAARKSYWNGCSTGGRQGLMSAQRFPDNYNGILAAAPAINWATFVASEIWPQVVMCEEGYYPAPCELEAIRQAAIAACDEIDGVKDGLVSAPGLCKFDANTVIDAEYDCGGEKRTITPAAAKIANRVWEGPMTPDGKREWYGNTHETPFSGLPPASPFSGNAGTICDSDNKNCKGLAFPLSEEWIKYFIHKDPDYDTASMDRTAFFNTLHRSRNEYKSIIDTADPDLSEFKALGGKMITWHGLADQLIFPNGTADYYERVLSLDPMAYDFYRYYEAPGVAHCAGGVGAFPGHALEALVSWVEGGTAPSYLNASTVPADKSQAVKHRMLCPYPAVAAYKGGDPNDAASFKCADSFDAFTAEWPQHAEL